MYNAHVSSRYTWSPRIVLQSPFAKDLLEIGMRQQSDDLKLRVVMTDPWRKVGNKWTAFPQVQKRDAKKNKMFQHL